MIDIDTNYLEQIYDTVKDYEDVEVSDILVDLLEDNVLNYIDDKTIVIRNYAFYNCTSLTSVNLHNATIIGERAFNNCNVLESVNLPNVTSIGSYAFYNCTSLTSVIIRTNTVCTLIDVITFPKTPIALGAGYIYVPSALIEQYKTDSKWSEYASQFRALEDYTIDGTTTGELDPNKI